MVMKVKNPVPGSLEAWLVEIAAAYQDASEAIPFGPAAGEPFGEAALASYIATRGGNPEVFENPHLSFAFCYLASHHGLGLVGEAQTEEIMDYVERNRRSLECLITRGAKPNELRLFAARSRGKRRC
jgi:hypothetical protein